MCIDWIILVQHSPYHGCWYPGSLRHQQISTHDIDCGIGKFLFYMKKDFNYLCQLSVWRNDINHKYIFYVSYEKFGM